MNPVSLDDQISCVLREIVLRRRLYPRWVGERKMSQHKSDTELRAMEAVLATLCAMVVK